MRKHPLKPRLAFRVGIIGHRPQRLKAADLPELKSRIGDILATARDVVHGFASSHADLFSGRDPVLRGVSPLAEGSDRLFAESALAHGFELCCPMPFPQPEFENDFRPPTALEDDALETFRALLARAQAESALTRFELDGHRDDEGRAYANCGRVVLSQSDLLIVIWDGRRLGKIGGTEDTFDAARRQGIPIVWIDAVAPHVWQILEGTATLRLEKPVIRSTPVAGIHGPETQRLKDAVRQALALPEDSLSARALGKTQEEPPRTTIEDFYHETKPALDVAPLWTWFNKLVGEGKFVIPKMRVKSFEDTVDDDWPAELKPFYAWSDQLAVLYGNCYRSAFVLAYLLSVTAVWSALVPLAASWALGDVHIGQQLTIAGEILALVAIGAVVLVGRRRRWHERWLDYRLTAELLRHLRFVRPLAGDRSFPQVPAHWARYGDPPGTWMAWYVRAIEREMGLPTVTLDRDYVRRALASVVTLLTGQVDFHQRTARRSQRIERRLHVFGLTLLVVTVVACVAQWLFGATSWDTGIFESSRLVFLRSILPAVGAALAGIVNQGEFRRIAKRSDAMKERLDLLCGSAKDLHNKLLGPSGADDLPPSREAVAIVSAATQLMIREVLDWRVVVLDQSLRPPS